MFETLEATADGTIGHLTLNQPEKLNPLSTTALVEIAAAARWFDEQTHIKVVIVRGAGRAFSAGADLASFSGRQEVSTRVAADTGREMADAWSACAHSASQPFAGGVSAGVSSSRRRATCG